MPNYNPRTMSQNQDLKEQIAKLQRDAQKQGISDDTIQGFIQSLPGIAGHQWKEYLLNVVDKKGAEYGFTPKTKDKSIPANETLQIKIFDEDLVPETKDVVDDVKDDLTNDQKPDAAKEFADMGVGMVEKIVKKREMCKVYRRLRGKIQKAPLPPKQFLSVEFSDRGNKFQAVMEMLPRQYDEEYRMGFTAPPELHKSLMENGDRLFTMIVQFYPYFISSCSIREDMMELFPNEDVDQTHIDSNNRMVHVIKEYKDRIALEINIAQMKDSK